MKSDDTTLDRLLADEFSFVGGATKAQYLASITLQPADSPVESALSENVEVQLYGNTATVVGPDTIKGKSRAQAYENSYLFLNVWVKRSGRWQCVKVYSTPRQKE